MTINIGINGFGRIGRMIVRALYESEYKSKMKITAINDLSNINMNTHLLKFDSTHGEFNESVEVIDSNIKVGSDIIKFSSHQQPQNINWENVDVVFECSGIFTSKEQASNHLASGAKKVLISAPGKDVDATIVYGVNDNILNHNHIIVSNASCTTNCLAPIAKIINDSIGIEAGLMNTIHAFTNDQVLLDSSHSDFRRARNATASMIPTKTGAAAAVGIVLPELEGKLDGFAVRVPTSNVSLVDLSIQLKRQSSVDEINNIMIENSKNFSNILTINSLPLVSCDFNHNKSSAVFDTTQTKVIGTMAKVLAWYDNEWGFSNRMLDTAYSMMKKC